MAEIISIPSLISDSGLKALCRLEPGGTFLRDISNNTLTLTNNNSVAQDSGAFGGAANFGVVNTNKNLSVSNDLGITNGAITISLWVKLNTEIAADQWSFCFKGDGGTHVTYGIIYEYNAGIRRVGFQRIREGVAGDGPYYNIALGTSNWYHLVMTYDGSNVRGYLNGALVGGPTSSSGNGSAGGSDKFTIGGEASWYASCMIDDVSIFNRALTAAEIETIYLSQTKSVMLFPHSSSGFVRNHDLVWATSRNGATGDITDNTTNYAGAELSGGFYDIYRMFWKFLVENIPQDGKIKSARLRLYLASKDTSTDFALAITGHTAPDTSLTTADFDSLTVDSPTEYASRTANVSTLSTNQWINFELNTSAIANIVAGSYAKIAGRSSLDIDNSTPLFRSYAEFQIYSASNPPELIVDYDIVRGIAVPNTSFVRKVEVVAY